MLRMKYVTFTPSGATAMRLGVLHGDAVVDIETLLGDAWTAAAPATLLALIEAGEGEWRRVAAAIETRLAGGAPRDVSHVGEEVRWHAPVPRPQKNIVCLGLNYRSHVEEGARARGQEIRMPTDPVFFTKAPTTVNGPFDDVSAHLDFTAQVDWEAELALVVGIAGVNISRDRALSHVFGYTVLNDITARDLQFAHKQWFRGKSLDGFCPIGPVVVTADEFGDPQHKRISSSVNGVVKQDATTADMLFPVDVIIERLSQGLTLEPGDIVSTGTPEGVGMGRTPQEFLHAGDIVEASVEGIGTLRNRIV